MLICIGGECYMPCLVDFQNSKGEVEDGDEKDYTWITEDSLGIS